MSWECACGISNSDSSENCGGCGWTRAQLREYMEGQAKGRVVSRQTRTESRAVPFGVVFFFVGGFIGYLLRPSLFLFGQLPFSAVITRGASFQGMDALLVPVAEQSFNYMLLGSIAAAVIGGIIGSTIGKKVVSVPVAESFEKYNTIQSDIQLKGSRYCGYCGTSIPDGGVYCPKCGKQS